MSVDQGHARDVDGAAKALAIVGPPAWFLLFARALHEVQGTALDWLELLEKPQKWAPEYSAWCRAGHPQSPGDAGWSGFVDEIG